MINKNNKHADNTDLSISQRIIAVFFYLLIFLLICRYFNQDWTFLIDSSKNYNLLFVSGALLLVFGTYIAEPFFTKPIDVITNATAVTLALLTIKNPGEFLGYEPLFYTCIVLILSSILLIFFANYKKIELIQKVCFKIITSLGQSKIIFSIIYIFTIISYFRSNSMEFFVLLTFWILLVTKLFVEKIIVFVTKLIQYVHDNKSNPQILGEAIGCENPFLYKIEVDYHKHKIEVEKGDLIYLSLDKTRGVVGIIINEKQLLNKKWLTAYLLKEKGKPLKINLKTHELITETNTIYSKDNAVYKLDLNLIEKESKQLVETNYLFKNKEKFIGYVADGSDINKIKFYSLIDTVNARYKLLKEGSVIKTEIYGVEDVLYQIIDGKTGEEQLEKHNTYGYLMGTAQKLGRYSEQNKQLDTVKWLPDIYSPVFFDNSQVNVSDPLSIGVLPETNFQIILKDPDALVTHNTAILGILGIGKSCLTFELIQKVIRNTDAKVICIDITNEYKKELPKYIEDSLIQEEIRSTCLQELITNNRNGNQDNPNSWGNEDLYKTKLDEEFKLFSEGNKRIILLNPDWHNVSKAGNQFKIQHKVDLTISEKTRIISERLFMYAKSLFDSPSAVAIERNKARFLIVFEEAHSLIPEWNSVANSGDQSASNGTAKVILQGRKYGLGSLVVTQRTANISKSILNQCNTIFALRVFDDTGKQFLENYIGSDYSNTLSTLEERYAILVGKSLQLKQPVIVKLNDKDSVMLTS